MRPSFDSVLSIVEQLTVDEQLTLVDILKNRLAEVKRKQIATDIKNARQEFKNGECEVVSVDEILHDISS